MNYIVRDWIKNGFRENMKLISIYYLIDTKLSHDTDMKYERKLSSVENGKLQAGQKRS